MNPKGTENEHQSPRHPRDQGRCAGTAARHPERHLMKRERTAR